LVATFLAGAAFFAGAFVAGAALVAFVVEPVAVPTAFRAVAAACLATDNASLATM
jgi:hypothetical protein